MKCFVGIDLGSTTTKALILDEEQQILGRGITNSRSNYDIAASVAKEEALVNTRINLVRQSLEPVSILFENLEEFLSGLERTFRLEQFMEQLADLESVCHTNASGNRFASREKTIIADALRKIFHQLREEAPELFAPGASRKSDFFRDIAGSRYLAIGEASARELGLSFDLLLNVYDRSIIEVENHFGEGDARMMMLQALQRMLKVTPELESQKNIILEKVEQAYNIELEESYVVGTGYGRARLPFSKDHIRSEILCHGLGAHIMYPETRTVLDIGGQDTKAIQVDPSGIVSSFQMNDRCAAGCGRYLGYIADEMNVGLHELGPMAMKATRKVRINSTCTVFAGAELRDRLALGEEREDILAGLHRAIILRAMSLLSRSGGISDQFTFTGGVANNEAAVMALKGLIQENYGEVTVNIDPGSIYTGALGAATFAHRAMEEHA